MIKNNKENLLLKSKQQMWLWEVSSELLPRAWLLNPLM